MPEFRRDTLKRESEQFRTMVLRSVKIIHIHTNLNFVYLTDICKGESIDNQIFFVGDSLTDKSRNENNLIFFQYSKTIISEIVSRCNKADIVILYDLDSLKSVIANKVRKDVIVIWRFFGYELYSKMPQFALSKLTVQALKNGDVKAIIHRKLSNIRRNFFKILNERLLEQRQFKKAIKRINYFFGLMESEYQLLKSHWPELPPFLQHPYDLKFNDPQTEETEKNYVIVGNSRSIYNNHLEIIEVIRNTENKGNYTFVVPFNYGGINNYTERVMLEASGLNNVKVLEEFLSLDEYKKFFNKAVAFVLNGERQMAMGNIFESLEKNLKIYLNEKSMITGFLKSEGFKVFTISDFADDLNKNNLNLTKVDSLHNAKQLEILNQKYSVEQFQAKLIRICSK